MVILTWARVPQEKFVFSHINPEYHYKHHIYGYYSQDLLAFVEYIIASFEEKYQWTAWKLFFDVLKDMPTIRSIEVNHNIGRDVNASTLEECNFRKKVQIITLSDSEVQIRIPTGRVQDIRPDIQNENHYHDRLYFQWYWSWSNKPHNWIVIHLRHGQLRQREATVWWILEREKTIITCNKHYFMPPSLRPKNSIFSHWRSHTHCENNQWTLRGSGGRHLESTVTFRTKDFNSMLAISYQSSTMFRS